MTTQEFSIEFDILYNNLASNAAPPLNEYEKSVFLTKAQSDIVIELYSGRNNLGLAYDSTEEAREYLASLETTEDVDVGYNNDTKKWSIPYPSEIWYITREELNGVEATPCTQDEYAKIKNNPFRGPKVGKRIIRIGNTLLHNENIPLPTSEEGEPPKYTYYGIKKPNPIVLPGIDDSSLTIDGENISEMFVDGTETPTIHPALHRVILERAVLLAKMAYVGGQAQQAQQ